MTRIWKVVTLDNEYVFLEEDFILEVYKSGVFRAINVKTKWEVIIPPQQIKRIIIEEK